MSAGLNRLLVAALFVLGFVALDWISFVHPFGALPLTPWNPHTGAALAWMIRFGPAGWPVVALAHALVTAKASGDLLGLWAIVVAALGYGGGYGGAAVLLRRERGHRLAAPGGLSLGRFFVVAPALSLAVSALAVVAFWADGNLSVRELPAALARGWIGDLIGILLFVPLLLRLERWPWAVPGPGRERLAQAAVMVAASWVVFGLEMTDEFKFFYLLFPPMLWAAVRGGAVPCLSLMALAQVCLIVAADLRGLADDKVTALQLLMLVLVATGLLVSAQAEARQRAEAALRERLGELARLGRIHSAAEIATGLAHELKQPMLAIVNYVGAAIRLLERQPPAIDDALGIMRKADMQVGRADTILRRMRTYVQKGEPHISSVEVAEIVREAVDLVTPLVRRHAIRVDTVHLAGLPPLLADPVQVLQILVNLLSNAVHAIADHDCPRRDVTLAARRVAPGRIELAVSDSGPGLPADLVDDLYQPFVTARPDGMGLGLAISRSIAEAHGGTLAHDSPQPGLGATFRVVLPCAEDEHDR